jgi:hypothetical protein
VDPLPGLARRGERVRSAWGGVAGAHGFRGVGAIALRHGAAHDGGLRKRIDAILGVSR